MGKKDKKWFRNYGEVVRTGGVIITIILQSILIYLQLR